MLKTIEARQQTISEAQQTILENITQVLNEATENQEALEKINQRLDEAIEFNERLIGLKAKLERLSRAIRYINDELRQDRLICATGVLEHAKSFRGFKPFESPELMLGAKNVIDQEEFLQVQMGRLLERVQAQTQATPTLPMPARSLEAEKNFDEAQAEFGRYVEQAAQQHSEAHRVLSSMEKLMRLTVVNQMIASVDRAVETLVALKFDRNDLNSLIRAARLGSAEAMYALGETYRFGVDVDVDEREAFVWYEGAANADYVPAIAELASCYNFGVGVEIDEQKAIELYEKAAALGSTEAMCRLASMYFDDDEPDYAKAFDWYKRAAELGDDEGMNMVGRCFFQGLGVEADHDAAFDWHKKAAALDNIDSMYAVGMMYFNGDGVNEDKFEGVDWLKKAVAKLDETGSNLPDGPLYQLARCYHFGLGTDKDEEKALELFKRVDEHGVENQFRARLELAKINFEARNYDAALTMFMDVANNGEVDVKPEAMNMVGRCCYSGLGTQYNKYAASQWFQKASTGGNTEARVSLAKMYRAGDGVPQNSAEALILFGKASEKGNLEAIFNVADMSRKGEGCVPNKELALHLFQEATKRGDVEAMYNVGEMYFNGEGVEKNFDEALKMFERASEFGHAKAMYMAGRGHSEMRNSVAATDWYEKAARAGNQAARDLLGWSR